MKMNRRLNRICIFIALLSAFTLTAACSSLPPTPFTMGSSTAAPIGSLYNWSTSSVQGSAQSAKTANLDIDSLVNEMQEVLDELNNKFVYVLDYKRFNRVDYWATLEESILEGKIVGDCDEFALHARDMLLKRGIHSRLMLVISKGGALHVVNEVNGWILDNNYIFVMSRDDLDYYWVKMSDDTDWTKWYIVNNGNPQMDGNIGDIAGVNLRVK